MQVTLAKTAGFCMGVRRAVDLALQAARSARPPVFTWGPLIHNRQVVEHLQQHGIAVTEVPPASGTVVIRAHGVPPAVLQDLKERGLTVVDATCPHVIASQRNIRSASERGLYTVIAGDPEHPEVIGLAAHAATPVTILSTRADAESFRPESSFFLIAQTTFKETLYADIRALLLKRYPDCQVFDSICDATSRRQTEAESLARELGALVVAGDPQSANTRRLAEVGREAGARVWLIEEASELPLSEFAGLAAIGLTAGASTPDWVIDAIAAQLRTL